ncbi:hypothetical protein AQUCO_01400428v1 [Aquilegia coerulea]|uniref:Uncharacterized protein n=1 Tax=Aquilegia coerulea TaxID=218851 RepID=A0A2G5DWB9_AQUCA|nr:hypothetical protein AQUCO_01400428v1 [Aquilegia coerulea]
MKLQTTQTHIRRTHGMVMVLSTNTMISTPASKPGDPISGLNSYIARSRLFVTVMLCPASTHHSHHTL